MSCTNITISDTETIAVELSVTSLIGAPFTSLSDVPTSYTGKANKVVSVNSTENGLEFTSASASTLTKTTYLGSACTGTDGATNRQLTAAATPIFVYVERQCWLPLIDYTVTGDVITFLVEIYDTYNIMVVT